MTLLSPDRIIGPFRGKVTDFGGDIGLKSDFYHVPGSEILCVLIPPWKTQADHYKPVRKRIGDAGFSCLEYKIASSLLSPDHAYTLAAFKEVEANIRAGMEETVRKYGFKQVQVIGLSIGCIEAVMVSVHNPHVAKVVLVAPGCDLAESMWHGLKTQNIRQLFEDKGITLEFLKEAWRDLAPERDFEGLKGKEVELYISKYDVNIPYRFGKRLADQMKAYGITTHVYENKYLGHYLTVLKYLKKGKIR
jgi:hypothetical protein